MEVFANLFDDWVGILSLGTIAFILLMAVFFIFYFLGKSSNE